MSWETSRVLIVLAVVAASVTLAWWFRVLAARRGPSVEVGSLQAFASAVVFTRDKCSNCAKVLRLVEGLGIPMRQIRIEENVETFERLGVTAVPLTVITDSAGRSRAQFGGIPSRWALRRATRLAREIPGQPSGLP